MNQDKLTDEVNKGFGDTGDRSHVIRITNTSNTGNYQLDINLATAEEYENHLDKQTIVKGIQIFRGRSRARDVHLIRKRGRSETS